jgi:hypothetical protein
MGDMAEMYDYDYLYQDWNDYANEFEPGRSRRTYGSRRTPVNRVASLDEFAVVGPTHDEFGNEL